MQHCSLGLKNTWNATHEKVADKSGRNRATTSIFRSEQRLCVNNQCCCSYPTGESKATGRVGLGRRSRIVGQKFSLSGLHVRCGAIVDLDYTASARPLLIE